MSKFWYIAICLTLLIAPTALAIPDIQLFIDGATYDWQEQSWVLASTGSIDLYVISANDAVDDIIVSVALGQSDNPHEMSVNFGGTMINNTDWVYGFPPLPPEFSPGGDLARHSVYPTYFAEVHTGAYGLGMMVGDVQPDTLNGGVYWDPTPTPAFPAAEASQSGEWKMFTVDINGPIGSSVHFDAYTVDENGNILRFAPFSHDASTTIVPEPGTFVLMGSGLLGLGFRFYRKRKRS